MSRKLLITEALDERDFLKEKIKRDISRLNVIAIKRRQDEKIKGITESEFKKDNSELYQSITDRIDLMNKINVAIIQSNAVTTITVNGKEYTIAQAIATKSAIAHNSDLTTLLYRTVAEQKGAADLDLTRLDREVRKQREDYANALLSNADKELDETQLSAIDKMIEPLIPEVVMAIDVAGELEKMLEKLDGLAAKLNTAIKISNATTYIEI